MATLTIGGEAVSVSLNVYARLKRAWKYISAAQGTQDFVTANDAMIGVAAVGLDNPFPGEPEGSKDEVEAWRIAYIGDHLTGGEMKGLVGFLNVLMVESGLAPAPGETAAAASPSTETLTPSSQS